MVMRSKQINSKEQTPQNTHRSMHCFGLTKMPPILPSGMYAWFAKQVKSKKCWCFLAHVLP